MFNGTDGRPRAYAAQPAQGNRDGVIAAHVHPFPQRSLVPVMLPAGNTTQQVEGYKINGRNRFSALVLLCLEVRTNQLVHPLEVKRDGEITALVEHRRGVVPDVVGQGDPVVQLADLPDPGVEK